MTGWDVFICHASEDKNEVARPLAIALAKSGVEVWYDEFSLALGDSLRRTIDHGLAHSRYGIVVLSPAFFAKQWPQYELDGLVQKELTGSKAVLPIWHNVTRSEVSNYSLPLSDKVGVPTSSGMSYVLAAILKVLQQLSPDEQSLALWKQIQEIDKEAGQNKPSARLESSAIASTLVTLMARSRSIGRAIYSSALTTKDTVALTRRLSELQSKIDWYIDLNG